PMRSWSACFMCPVRRTGGPSEAEVLAQVYLPDLAVFEDGGGFALGDDAAFGQYVGARTDAQGLAHVMVGDQHADAAVAQVLDDALDVDHGNRVDARE